MPHRFIFNKKSESGKFESPELREQQWGTETGSYSQNPYMRNSVDVQPYQVRADWRKRASKCVVPDGNSDEVDSAKQRINVASHFVIADIENS